MNRNGETEYNVVDWLLMAVIVVLSAVTLTLLFPMFPGWYVSIISVHKWRWWVWLTICLATAIAAMWLRARQEQ